ncbi:acyltransferase [Clostridium sp. OF03-18AA]|nr:acyltransferase family protein [Clostridium sp. OF03-18AA]RHP70440.1 acyltransferase [Clostridium sp. OF03-18AA]
MNAGKEKNRVQYFDIARGIAMICIILGHLNNSLINRVVFTFHVPIFFFISGYFMNSKCGIKDYARNKLRTLIVPYIVTCIVIIILGTLKGFIQGDAISELGRWSYAAVYGAGDSYNEPFYIPGIGAIWFLWATFWGCIFLRLSLQFERHVRLGVIIGLFIFGYFSRQIFWFPLSIQAGACAVLFMYIGYIARNVKDNIGDLSAEAKTFGLVFAAVVWFFFMKDFQSFWLVHCDIGRGIVDVFGSMCACVIVIYISKMIEIKFRIAGKFLAFFGRYSLLVLCVHIIELDLFPWWMITGRLEGMGISGSGKLWFVIVGKLVADLGFAYIISRVAIVREVFGYES